MGDDQDHDREHPESPEGAQGDDAGGGTGGESSEQFQEKPPPERVEEIEKERAERLDPDNRPENAEIDNSDAELPTVEEFHRNQDDDTEGSAGTSDPSEKFREMEVPEEEVREIEEERKRRLAPENRPENAEVDNTGDNMPDVARDEPSSAG